VGLALTGAGISKRLGVTDHTAKFDPSFFTGAAVGGGFFAGFDLLRASSWAAYHVVAKLPGQCRRRTQTANPDAFDLYLKGR
jgi:hypothetical protein